MDKIETLLIADVARALGTSPAKVKAAIKNGTMPIGMVGQEPGSTQERTVIVKERWDKWRTGQL